MARNQSECCGTCVGEIIVRLVAAFCMCAGLAFGPTFAQAQTYKYDDKGRLVQVDNANGLSTIYTYDAADNRTSAVTATTPPPPPANHAPVCSNWQIVNTAPPQAGTVTVSPTAANFISNCSDADGDTLTLTSPTTLSWQVAWGQTVSPIGFTVSDGKGGTGTASLTICRPSNGASTC